MVKKWQWKKYGIMVLTIAVIVIVILCGYNLYRSNSTANTSTQTGNQVFAGNELNWAKSVIGKNVYIKQNELWIDNINMKVAISKDENDINGKKITDCYTDKDQNLIIRLSNQNEIVIGKSRQKVDLNTKKYLVRFFGENKELLKEENVREGENAVSPNPKDKKGYSFEKWDKQFDHVTSNLDVYAIYQKKSTITEIYVENKKACVDGEVQTYVKVKNNSGILGMIIQVDYDSKHLELIKAENGNAVKNNLTLTKGKKLVSGCKFVWDGVQLSDGGKKDGNILSLKFKIKKSVEGDEYKIKLKIKDGDVVNQKLLPIECIATDGYINIGSEKREE